MALHFKVFFDRKTGNKSIGWIMLHILIINFNFFYSINLTILPIYKVICRFKKEYSYIFRNALSFAIMRQYLRNRRDGVKQHPL